MSAAALVQPLSVALLLVMMAGLGMKVSFAQVGRSITPSLVVRGLLANFLLTPIATVLFLRAYHVQPLVAAGFLILAVCAGAAFTPAVTAMAKGSVPSAIGLMVVLSAFDAILVPVLLRFLLSRLPGTEDIQISFLAILKTLLITQMLPLLCALGVHAWKPAIAPKLAKPLNVVTQVLMLVVNVVVFIAYWDDLKRFQLRAYVGMTLLFVVMFAIGWFLSAPGYAERKAMALTSAVRNTGVSLVIIAEGFANTPAVPAVVVFGLVMTIAAILSSFPLRKLGLVEDARAYAVVTPPSI